MQKAQPVKITQAELDAAKEKYFKNGGTIQVLKAQVSSFDKLSLAQKKEKPSENDSQS